MGLRALAARVEDRRIGRFACVGECFILHILRIKKMAAQRATVHLGWLNVHHALGRTFENRTSPARSSDHTIAAQRETPHTLKS